MRLSNLAILITAIVAIPALAVTWNLSRAETIADLLQRTHIHGLAVGKSDAARLLVATHHGLYRATSDGAVERISAHQDDLMGFSPHPSDADILYASGHPSGGGNLGVIRSDDGGREWTRISPGANGPVDFHQMAVSAADPSVMFGVYGQLQRSDDGGYNWRLVGPPPDGLIALAGSAREPERLFGATEQGITVSHDGGESWEAAHPAVAPVTAIANVDGTLYAYMLGTGLLRAGEAPSLQWEQIGPEIGGEDVILHITVDPDDRAHIFAATWRGRLLASEDEGASWREFGSR